MLQKLMERRRNENEKGFTLIELMVVVLIIAILIAIAIPTFLGARQRANNRAAQSSLRNALTAAKTIFTDNNDYSTATAGAVSAVEPSLTFVANTASSDGPKTVSVKAKASGTEWVATVWSVSGNCYVIRDQSNGPGTSFGAVPGASKTTCTADAGDTQAVTGSAFP